MIDYSTLDGFCGSISDGWDVWLTESGSTPRAFANS